MATVGGTVQLGKGAVIHHEPPIRLIGPITIRDSIRIGCYSYFVGDARIGRVESIGRYCSIAPGFLAGLSSHPITWLSTSTFQYSKTKFAHGDWHRDFVSRGARPRRTRATTSARS